MKLPKYPCTLNFPGTKHKTSGYYVNTYIPLPIALNFNRTMINPI